MIISTITKQYKSALKLVLGVKASKLPILAKNL